MKIKWKGKWESIFVCFFFCFCFYKWIVWWNVNKTYNITPHTFWHMQQHSYTHSFICNYANKPDWHVEHVDRQTFRHLEIIFVFLITYKTANIWKEIRFISSFSLYLFFFFFIYFKAFYFLFCFETKVYKIKNLAKINLKKRLKRIKNSLKY